MQFIFPSLTKHLPNEDQLKLLITLLYNKKFPGFIHTNALSLNVKYKNEYQQYVYHTMTDDLLVNALSGNNYLYMPFDYPKSYILNSFNDIIGVITNRNLMTYWFEDPISIGELWTAKTRQIPIINKFVCLGLSDRCSLCDGYGAVDWVTDIQESKNYGIYPKTRYIFATHRTIYFLIDNKWILDYKGDEIISPCPRCLGLGCDAVLIRDELENKITTLNFDYNPMGYRLLVRDARNELIPSYPNYGGKW